MKKVLISLLIGVVTVGFIGCSSNSKVTDEEVKENVQVQVQEEEPKKEIKEEPKEDNTISLGKVDEEPRVLPTDLPYNLEVQAPDSIGTVYGHMTFVNNSNYPITSFEVVALDYTTNEITYYCYFDTVLQNETSPIFESFASDDMEILNIRYSIFDKESGLTCDYEYDAKLEYLQWTSWHETY